MKRVAAMVAALLLCGAGPLAPGDAASLAWQQWPGAKVPLDGTLRDEAGRPVRLRDALDGKPVILDLGYYHCPSLCGVVRSDLLHAIDLSGMASAHDFTLLSLSIDPVETPQDAAAAKATDLQQAPFMQGADWHYWTGTKAAVDAVERVVGFHARYDEVFHQYLHPAGLVVLTADGVVSSYILGVGYSPGDLKAAVVRAGTGGIAKAALPILLLCFHFDSSTGRYTLAIEKILRLMGGLTVLTIGALMFVLHRRGSRR